MRNNDEIVDVLKGDLRALLFWASVGVSKSKGGSYQNIIQHILESYAEAISFKLPYGSDFGIK